MRGSNWLGLAVAAVSISAAGARPARASDVQGALVRPTGVIFEPEAANASTALRVRIYGVAAIADASACYTTPACGYLYYSCKPGEEALCREQWQEIGAAATAGTCVSFGARRVNGMMADNGRLRPVAQVPSAPDPYLSNQGLGVAAIDCTPMLSCWVMLAGACPPPSIGDAGVGCCGPRGAGGQGGAGGGAAGVGGGIAGAGGMAGRGSGGVMTSAGGTGGLASSGGAAGMNAVKPGGGSGCAVAGGRIGGAGAAAIAAATLALAAAARRRRRTRGRG